MLGASPTDRMGYYTFQVIFVHNDVGLLNFSRLFYFINIDYQA